MLRGAGADSELGGAGLAPLPRVWPGGCSGPGAPRTWHRGSQLCSSFHANTPCPRPCGHRAYIAFSHWYLQVVGLFPPHPAPPPSVFGVGAHRVLGEWCCPPRLALEQQQPRGQALARHVCNSQPVPSEVSGPGRGKCGCPCECCSAAQGSAETAREPDATPPCLPVQAFALTETEGAVRRETQEDVGVGCVCREHLCTPGKPTPGRGGALQAPPPHTCRTCERTTLPSRPWLRPAGGRPGCV